MADYKTPGVYVEEISLLPPSVVGVQTAVPAFVGYTQKAEVRDANNTKIKDLLGVPTKIGSLMDFKTYFGQPKPDDDGLGVTIIDTLNGRSIVAALNTTKLTPFNLYYSLQSYFSNGGGACYIVSVGAFTEAVIAKTALISGIEQLKAEDEPTIIVVPEAIHLEGTDYAEVLQTALDQAAELKDRVVLIDVKTEEGFTNKLGDVLEKDIKNFRTLTLKNKAFGCAYYPYIETTVDYSFEGSMMISHLDRKTEHEVKGTYDAIRRGDVSFRFPWGVRFEICRWRPSFCG